jgi:YD repeat-containing protein
MKHLQTLTLTLCSIFLANSTYALVDMKNANFAQTFTDLEIPGSGYDMKVNRTYNSKSIYDGMFGYGWCSDFETVVAATAEGNIKMTECGAGQEVFFVPQDFGKKDIESTVNLILEKVKSAKKPDAKSLEEFKKDLTNDANLRSTFALSYKINKPIKEGSTFFANGKEVDKIVYTKGVYTRTLADGSSMKFNDKGRLTQLNDKNSNFLKLDYKNDLLKEVSDNNGRKLNLDYFTNKKVQKISGPNNLAAEYKFTNMNDLTWVKNSWKNEYTYEYDDAHNLIKGTYPDKTFFALTYDKKNDWVTSFTDREKCIENYAYEFNEKNPKNHYWSTVKKTCGKEVVNESKHEFWFADRADGQSFLQRILSVVNKSVTDITYHEIFGKPLSIRRNDLTYTYEYYPNGQVKVKKSNQAKLTYKYEEKTNKVNEILTEVIDSKGKVISSKISQFKYDLKGNLIKADNTEGMKIEMTYDPRGRIASITDQAKKIVKIEYEEKYGKPKIVTRPGLGAINVTYKSGGEIDKVTSPEGPSVAMQVASTFNNLLDIIAPATAEMFN